MACLSQNPTLISPNLCVVLFQPEKTIQRSKIDVTFRPLLLISLLLSTLSPLIHYLSIPAHLNPLNEAYKAFFLQYMLSSGKLPYP